LNACGDCREARSRDDRVALGNLVGCE
jgi:hypothetical protein